MNQTRNRNANAKHAPQGGKPRLTQAERSHSMQLRLIEACANCLARDGYAGTTFSRIIEAAGVSRGAPLHHFASKTALLAATAEHLVRRLYIEMGRAVQALCVSEDRLQDLIKGAWHGVFDRAEQLALHELLVASRREPELATILQEVWTACHDTLGRAAQYYLEPIDPNDDVRDFIVLTQWLMRGMAEDRHLIKEEQLVSDYLSLWSRLLRSQLKARPGVVDPPPQPPLWDKSINC
jgi:AcrR family transcriptional regulator